MSMQVQKATPVRFAFVLIPRFNMMALINALEPLRVANYLSGVGLYDWILVSPEGGSVVASNGLDLQTVELPRDDRDFDTIFMCGSWDSEHYEHRELFGWLRRHERMGVHLGAMDIGVYILARAGLLSGYRVAVLWYCIRAFSEAYPDIFAEERLYIRDRTRLTIAGGTAGMDAMLNDVSNRFGAQLAHEVADHVLHNSIRSDESAQRKAGFGQREIMHRVVRAAIHLMERHVEEPLSIPEISSAVNVTQRNLERLFQKYVGRPAIGHYQMLRLQHALVLLTNTDLSVREISVACGYGSLSYFAKSFATQYGKSPRNCRNAWPNDAPTPVWPGLSSSLIQRH